MRSLEQIALDLSMERNSKKVSELADEMHEVLREPGPKRRLLATCTNLSCARQFHVTANNQEQVDFFKALHTDPQVYGGVRVILVCPYCRMHLQIQASALTECCCGHEPHAEFAA